MNRWPEFIDRDSTTLPLIVPLERAVGRAPGGRGGFSAVGPAAMAGVLRQRATRYPVGPLFVRGGRSVRHPLGARGRVRWTRAVGRAIGSLSSTDGARRTAISRGAAGLWAYDLNRSLERIAPARYDEFGLPALAVGLYDVVVAFDHAEGRAYLISQGFPELDSQARLERARAQMR